MKKKILVIALSLNLLFGCVPALIVGAAIGGIVVYEGRNATVKKKDFELTRQIQQTINKQTSLHNHSRIVVSAYDGVVLLAGQAPSEALKNQAYQIARGVPGVKRLYNEITITGPISSLTQSSDAWLTTKVKSVLLARKGLDSSQIKVVTENGVVFLMGKVTKEQAKIAADATRTISGVQKVVTLFEFLRPAE